MNNSRTPTASSEHSQHLLDEYRFLLLEVLEINADSSLSPTKKSRRRSWYRRKPVTSKRHNNTHNKEL